MHTLPIFQIFFLFTRGINEGVLLGLYQPDRCLGTQDVSGAAFTIKWLMV